MNKCLKKSICLLIIFTSFLNVSCSRKYVDKAKLFEASAHYLQMTNDYVDLQFETAIPISVGLTYFVYHELGAAVGVKGEPYYEYLSSSYSPDNVEPPLYSIPKKVVDEYLLNVFCEIDFSTQDNRITSETYNLFSYCGGDGLDVKDIDFGSASFSSEGIVYTVYIPVADQPNQKEKIIFLFKIVKGKYLISSVRRGDG